ncbi:hypothetical protein CDAR_125611 [Caerostris darwini]|uniref:Uncharacterized protein n=1 Tax=Caerostris darwini TaxID=1538125 RepID=A0AAV4STS6_9ARAC|nr:hypothetical protein CDAR_125611 [Caerostris darwini]
MLFFALLTDFQRTRLPKTNSHYQCLTIQFYFIKPKAYWKEKLSFIILRFRSQLRFSLMDMKIVKRPSTITEDEIPDPSLIRHVALNETELVTCNFIRVRQRWGMEAFAHAFSQESIKTNCRFDYGNG